MLQVDNHHLQEPSRVLSGMTLINAKGYMPLTLLPGEVQMMLAVCALCSMLHTALILRQVAVMPLGNNSLLTGTSQS